jgi:hypothetical protein
MSPDTRQKRTARRARASTKGAVHVRRGRRRSVGTTTRSRLDARSASPAPALTEPSRRCDEEDGRGDATRHTSALMTARRHGACWSRRNDRRAHNKVGSARSARRLARSRRSLGVAGAGSDRAESAGRRRRQAR